MIFHLDEVYKSKNVLITSDKFFHFFTYNMDLDKELTRILQDQIKIKKGLLKSYNKIRSVFRDKKILRYTF